MCYHIMYLLCIIIVLGCIVSSVHSGKEKKEYHYCIVGGGPSGLQMAYLMAKHKEDFILFEKDRPGVRFEHYPIHRQLISINKIYTGKSNPTFNERHDWNSLLSDNESLKMKHFSEEYYPSADDYVKYLREYANYVGSIVEKQGKAPVTFVSK